MSDEEKKDEQVETEEQGSPEGSDAAAAGPDAADGGAAAGEVSSSTPPSPAPPADESSGDEEPADESSDEEAEDHTADDDDMPWKAKRRLERSRRPHEAKPQQSVEERKVARAEARTAKANLRRKQRQAAKGEKAGGSGTPMAEPNPNAAKVRQGIVTSDKGEKSITVRIDIARRHPTYEKIVRRSRTLHAHDERNEAGEGDMVRIVETRPLSKTKRWRLVEVLEKAK
jgi:small subunit ribosomal protein S17